MEERMLRLLCPGAARRKGWWFARVQAEVGAGRRGARTIALPRADCCALGQPRSGRGWRLPLPCDNSRALLTEHLLFDQRNRTGGGKSDTRMWPKLSLSRRQNFWYQQGWRIMAESAVTHGRPECVCAPPWLSELQFRRAFSWGGVVHSHRF